MRTDRTTPGLMTDEQKEAIRRSVAAGQINVMTLWGREGKTPDYLLMNRVAIADPDGYQHLRRQAIAAGLIRPNERETMLLARAAQREEGSRLAVEQPQIPQAAQQLQGEPGRRIAQLAQEIGQLEQQIEERRQRIVAIKKNVSEHYWQTVL